MNKILGYLAVFLIFSWVTTANANVVTITGSSGSLTITGFAGTEAHPTPFNDVDPRSMDFVFDFGTPGGAASGIVNIFNTLSAGIAHNGSASFTLTGLGAALAGNPFSANFVATMLTPATLGPLGPMDVEAFLLSPAGIAFTASGSINTTVSGYPISMNLLSASVLGSKLTLSTYETDPGRILSRYLGCLDGYSTAQTGYPKACQGALSPTDPLAKNNSLTAGFTNASVSVPEPTTLLLLGSGLLGLFGFSRKKA